MKRLTLSIAGAAAIALGAGAAAAQGWLPIVERQTIVEERIRTGLLTGDLTREQAIMLRADIDALVALEGRYRRNGLSSWERIDLDRRYAALDDRIRIAMDAADRFDSLAWLEDRKLELDRRIEQGLRSGQLTLAEADELRADFDAIAEVEARYRVDGLSARERADLDDRFDFLAERIGDERTDREREYGWSRWR